jgi:iron complex transport system ATP-binding protein
MKQQMHIESLSIGYGQRTILSDAHCDFNSGELVAIIGRNGQGKSTLLRTLAGLQKASSGKVLFNGQDLLSLSPKARATQVSIVLTERIPLQGVNVRTMLEMANFPTLANFQIFKHRQKEILEQRIDSALNHLNIVHLANKPLAELSDGEMQKAMIARSLVQNTTIILMDEPTAFLDYVAKEELFKTLKELAISQELIIVFTSHDIELVNRYADKIYKIEEGTISLTK